MPMFDLVPDGISDLPNLMSGAMDTPQLPIPMPSDPTPVDGRGMDDELKQMVFGGGLSEIGESAAAASTGAASVAGGSLGSGLPSLFGTNPALLF